MGKNKKYWQDLRQQEEELCAVILEKLHIIFHTRYEEEKKEISKNKNSKTDKKKKNTKKILPPGMKARRKIAFLLAYYGVGTPHTRLENQPPLSTEQKSMINMDYTGDYFIPGEQSLSKTYRKTREKVAAGQNLIKNEPKDFNLDELPIWNEMKKHKSFLAMSRAIKYQLSLGGFQPKDLKSLKYEDIIDLIARHSYEYTKERMIGQKQRFLKMFVACYGQKFLETEKLLGYGKQAMNFLTYIDYIDNPRECPEEAKKAANFYSIHHNKNRKFANELDNPSDVNNFRYLTLTRTFPHHKILHTPQTIDLNPNIVFFGSFVPEFQITRDPHRERLYANGKLNRHIGKSKEL